MSLPAVIPPHIEEFCDELRRTLASDLPDDRLAADRLPEGCSVRVGGEWCRFEGMQGEAMVLSSSSAGFTYTPSDGEVFTWGWFF